MPISRRQRIEFNAHRLFGAHVLELVEPQFEVESAVIVNDAEDLVHVKVHSPRAARMPSTGVEYGCIVLTLRKRT